MANFTVRDILDALDRVAPDRLPLGDFNETLDAVSGVVFSSLVGKSPGLVLARCLPGTHGEGSSFDYYRTRFHFRPDHATNLASGFLAYRELAKALELRGLGGLFVRNTLEFVGDECTTVVLTRNEPDAKLDGFPWLKSVGLNGTRRLCLGGDRTEGCRLRMMDEAVCDEERILICRTCNQSDGPDDLDETLAKVYRQVRAKITLPAGAEELAQIDRSDHAASIEAEPFLQILPDVNGTAPNYARYYNSFRALELWFTQSQVEECWICRLPFQLASLPWGGMYWLFEEPPASNPEERTDLLHLLQLTTRQIFFLSRWHYLEKYEREVAEVLRYRELELLTKDICNALVPLQALGQRLRRTVIPAAGQVLAMHEAPGVYIPWGTHYPPVPKRWRFEHDWSATSIGKKSDHFSAQVSFMLLSFFGRRNIPGPDDEAFDEFEPTNELVLQLGNDATFRARVKGFAETLSDEVDKMVQWLTGAAEEARDDAARAAMYDSFGRIAFQSLKGCFHYPFSETCLEDPSLKQPPHITGPLLLSWAFERNWRVEDAEHLRSYSAVKGTLWPRCEVLKAIDDLAMGVAVQAPQDNPVILSPLLTKKPAKQQLQVSGVQVKIPCDRGAAAAFGKTFDHAKDPELSTGGTTGAIISLRQLGGQLKLENGGVVITVPFNQITDKT